VILLFLLSGYSTVAGLQLDVCGVKMELEQALATLDVCSLQPSRGLPSILPVGNVHYIFPTGTGKTPVYEVCALCSPGVRLVVSSLLGLLQQQSGKLAAHGVAVLDAWDGKGVAVRARTSENSLHNR
jgi:hypothetical protein